MFRDPLFFMTFREKVVLILRTYLSIRIWHAGCSTGEEVYSIANSFMREDYINKRKYMYATDISTNVLKVAKTGVFPLKKMKKYTGL